MMDFKEVLLPNGVKVTMPYMQFKLDESREFLALAIDLRDFGGNDLKLDFPDYIRVEKIGKLHEQGVINMHRIQDTLGKLGWNYILYPDPEIILLTDKRRNGKIILLSN
jgi:hypothetical protein